MFINTFVNNCQKIYDFNIFFNFHCLGKLFIYFQAVKDGIVMVNFLPYFVSCANKASMEQLIGYYRLLYIIWYLFVYNIFDIIDSEIKKNILSRLSTIINSIFRSFQPYRQNCWWRSYWNRYRFWRNRNVRRIILFRYL